MNREQIRAVIREEIEKRSQLLIEAPATGGPPQNFAEFRMLVADALKTATAPLDLVDEVEDLGYEGGGIPGPIFDTWEYINSELQDLAPGEDASMLWPDVAVDYVHDMVLDIVREYENPMNYPPGHHRGKKKLDAKRLAQRASEYFAGLNGQEKSPEDHKARELRDMLGLVTDVLEMSKVAKNITQQGNRVTFEAKGDDYLWQIFERAQEAGLEADKFYGDDALEVTFRDQLTGLKVTFGDGFATIS